MNSYNRTSFPAAQIPLYLYPFLGCASNEKHIEYLRLTSLGVIGALVKVLVPSNIILCVLVLLYEIF